MKEIEQKRDCREGNSIHPHGSEFCKDVYCIRCNDGILEMYPEIGTIMDLSEVL